jgi:hypothetical protein
MLHQPTIEKLLAMRMEPIVEAWRALEQDENAQPLSFEEKLSLMVDRLWTWRQNLALTRRLRSAKLRGNTCVEDIDTSEGDSPQNLSMSAMAILRQLSLETAPDAGRHTHVCPAFKYGRPRGQLPEHM